jgi:uncharacterized RDD family membrane protein YckC
MNHHLHSPHAVLTSRIGPGFEATPRRKNWTVKTPCLKCGLIHDEPTAICDGYAGIDPDETAGDTRKKAAERIRAVLAAVPIESRRAGRARAAAAGAGASASESTSAMRAAGVGSISGDAPPAEVPEWRREVTERLETYRSRRARQSRQAGSGNQTILGFRVHSKTDSLESTEAISEASSDAAASLDAPASAPMAAASVPAAAPMAPPSAVTSEPLRVTSAMKSGERVYAADETDLTESLSEHAFAAAVESPATDSAETPETMFKSAGGDIAAVVLADSATLEVHADPAELPLTIEEDEETARLSPVASAQIAALAAAAPARAATAAPAPSIQDAEPAAGHAEANAAPLAAIPAIDKDYWRSAPEPGTLSSEPNPESEELECGSLTSGFDSPVGGIEEIMEEEFMPAEEAESAPPAAEPSLLPTEAAPALPAADEEPATEALAAAENTSELLRAGSLDIPETEDLDSRRAALRTASRPQPGNVSERIEISVPQPVFDFTVTNPHIEQPQDNALPVADLRERRRSAFIDATLLGFTIAGFFFAFHLAGGEFSYTRLGAAVAVAAAFLIYAQYILLFTLVGGATPGMVLRGLRVVCFDGRRPEGVELGWRAFGYLLSAAAGMLGFLWSACDEHGLSWHDRISQTYITYAQPEGEPMIATVQ